MARHATRELLRGAGGVVVEVIKKVIIDPGQVAVYIDEVIAFEFDPTTFLPNQHQGAFAALVGNFT